MLIETMTRGDDRRPIADSFRRTAHPAVRWCVDRGVHPNTVSYASVVAAGSAALCFALGFDRPMLLVSGALLCAVRLWLNMLDGMVAVESDRCTPWGAVVNELPDRISDALIFAGLAVSGLCNPALAVGGLAIALLIAYVGTLAQAVGAGRQFGGLMSKPQRMGAVGLGALWTALLFAPGAADARAFFELLHLSPLDVSLGAVILAGLQTLWVRLRATRRLLSAGGTS